MRGADGTISPVLVDFSRDWDVHWGYGLLTHGHMAPVAGVLIPSFFAILPAMGNYSAGGSPTGEP